MARAIVTRKWEDSSNYIYSIKKNLETEITVA